MRSADPVTVGGTVNLRRIRRRRDGRSFSRSRPRFPVTTGHFRRANLRKSIESATTPHAFQCIPGLYGISDGSGPLGRHLSGPSRKPGQGTARYRDARRAGLPPGSPLPYAEHDVPQGGRVTLALQGTYDSLNPLIVLGVAPDAVPRYVLQSLMMRSADEPFTLYGLVARAVEMPQDRSSITFDLDPAPVSPTGIPHRRGCGSPSTPEGARQAVLSVHLRPGESGGGGRPHRIRFDLSGSNNRELPLNIGMMPIFAAHATSAPPSTRRR